MVFRSNGEPTAPINEGIWEEKVPMSGGNATTFCHHGASPSDSMTYRCEGELVAILT